MPNTPLLDRLDSVIASAVATADVDARGAWSSTTQRSYQTAAQLGSGRGPYIEIVNHVWKGHLTAGFAFTGMAFLQSESGVHWAKAAHASEEIRVRVALHADFEPRRMTLAVGLDDVFLPAIPVEKNFQHPSECLVAAPVVPTARVACIARVGAAAFFVILFKRDSVKFGRNRLWRLRDSIASELPSDVCQLLTRRRAGLLHSSALR